jgi:TolB protein
MGADGKGERVLAPSPGEDTSPAWSPDGSRLVLVSDRDADRVLYMVQADGSGVRRLTNRVGADFAPQFQPRRL